MTPILVLLTALVAEPSPDHLFTALYVCAQKEYPQIAEDCADLDRAIRTGGDRSRPVRRILRFIKTKKRL